MLKMMKLTKVGLVRAADVGEQVAEDYGDLLDTSADLLENLVEQTREDIKLVDSRFQPHAKTEEVAKLRQNALENISSELEKRRRKLDQALEKARANLPDSIQLPTTDREYVLGRVRELQRWLLAHEPAERQALVDQWTGRGDKEFGLAVQEAHPAMSIVPPADAKKAIERVLRHAHPDRFEAVERVESALSLLESNARRAANTITSSSLLGPDTVANVAAGGEQAA